MRVCVAWAAPCVDDPLQVWFAQASPRSGPLGALTSLKLRSGEFNLFSFFQKPTELVKMARGRSRGHKGGRKQFSSADQIKDDLAKQEEKRRWREAHPDSESEESEGLYLSRLVDWTGGWVDLGSILPAGGRPA